VNRRRTFIGLIGLAAASLSLAASTKKYRVGLVLSTSPATTMGGPNPSHPMVHAFLQEMRSLGYVEGRNLEVQRRSLEGRTELGSGIVADFINGNVDVIVAGGNPAISAAARASVPTPVVMVNAVEPVAAKYIATLSRPGGRITGTTLDAGPDVVAKALQILREALQSVRRVAYVCTKAEWDSDRGAKAGDAARALGMSLVFAEHALGDYANTFAVIARERADALLSSPTPHHFTYRDRLAAMALKHKVPTVSTWSRDLVAAGGLISYGPDPRDNFRRAASYVDRILRGSKPADLPVEQPVKFELAINLKTARALGITIAPSLLLRADEVIQ
jgi:putative tryptophan/tyrosine transport system substrate-binding protein